MSLRDKFKPIGFKKSETNNKIIFYGKSYDKPYTNEYDITYF